jgi:predicted dehydrogenase
MRFALLGIHPDGIGFAEALVATGRHELVGYSQEHARLAKLSAKARRISDVEELLSDPSLEAVVVASAVDQRPDQLRRALQSEHHVLCVHPAGNGPEIAYEVGMIRDDVQRVLMPILFEAWHPGVGRLKDFVRRGSEASEEILIGEFVLLEIERPGPTDSADKLALPGWDMLRAVGGEIAEVSAFAAEEEANAGEPILLTGKFEKSGLFQATLLPPSADPSWRFAIVGKVGRAELFFPVGIHGPSFLNWRSFSGEDQEEAFDTWDPWPAVIDAFEDSVAGREANFSWQDAVRALELDDAARRSIKRRRSSLLEYPEATEEVGFKGTMTLVGCAVLWAVLLLVILTAWVPWLRWTIVPLLVVFLASQLLRYALPKQLPTTTILKEVSARPQSPPTSVTGQPTRPPD